MPIFPFKPRPTPIQQHITLPALPNAQAGQHYQVPFAAPHIADVIPPPNSGLHWHNGHLHGTPATAGDIMLTVLVRGTDGVQQISHRLHVNPDPKSLWQNLPSDASDPFHKADNASQRLGSAHGTLLAARIRGRSHAHSGSFCDDDFRLAIHPSSGAHILVLADGAGSAHYSRLGAQLAVNAAADAILAQLDNGTLHAATDSDTLANIFDHSLQAALQAHEHAVAAHPQIPGSKALSCTLLIAFTLPVAQGWRTAAYWIGDGAIALDDGTNWRLLGSADSGLYSGETQFLNHAARSPETLATRTIWHDSARAPQLIIMTDGVSDPLFASDAELADPARWQALWQELQTPLCAADPATALQEWLGFWSPGNHDDRTLALFIPGKHP